MSLLRSQREKAPLGIDLIAELGRRGLRGAYFDYAGYRRLRGVRTVDDMRLLLDDYHFEIVPASDDVKVVADGLQALQDAQNKKRNWLAVLGSVDPLLLIFTWPLWLILFGYWLLWSPDAAAARRISEKPSKVE